MDCSIACKPIHQVVATVSDRNSGKAHVIGIRSTDDSRPMSPLHDLQQLLATDLHRSTRIKESKSVFHPCNSVARKQSCTTMDNPYPSQPIFSFHRSDHNSKGLTAISYCDVGRHPRCSISQPVLKDGTSNSQAHAPVNESFIVAHLGGQMGCESR